MWPDRREIRMPTRTLVFVAIALSLSSSAQAAPRTFVATYGSDANLCSRAAPCRSFSVALAKTDPKGEIVALDSGGFGTVTINKAVALIAPPGIYAGITVPTGDDGITVAAGATDDVVVRGLAINGTPPTCCSAGIRFLTGHALHVENVVVSGIPGGGGILFLGNGELYVRDSEFRENPTGVGVAGTTLASIEHSRFDNNTVGMSVNEDARVAVRDSVFSGNTFRGIRASENSEVSIDGCTISGNNIGIVVENTSLSMFSIARVTNSLIANNGTGVLHTGGNGTLLTGGGNSLVGNTTAGTFSGSYAKQ